ncbi:hypothetical protein DCCM_3872 [Desulfocucumis palustris]|uniref:DUF4397 domain-containing protein n=1 Tax=Desulfocucumis palustris TaxID=1898651 RepID=A0A2L2XF45_9FIRM|nr:hypothetical protein DCCM_3872 [Desulfocucumis palustris]
MDVYVNNKAVARDLSYRDFTEYSSFGPGDYDVKVYRAGSEDTPLVDTSLNLADNSIITLATAGKLADIEVLPISDKPGSMNSNRVNIKFVHLSPDAPGVDVTTGNGTVLFRNVSFKDITEYTAISPGTYTLQLREAGSNDVLLTVPNQSFSGGRAYSAYAVGLAEGEPSLQMLTPLDGSSYLVTDGNGQNESVLDSKQADVNGDGVLDTVSLTGNKSGGESSFADDIRLCVRDGKTGGDTCAAPPFNAGYNANLFLGDFTGDDISDILVRIESGGSGGYLYGYVYTMRNNNLVKIFDSEDFNADSRYNAVFRDNYKVEVTGANTNQTYTIDLSGRKSDYSDIYDQNGRLKRPVTGEVLGLGGLEPVDVDNNGDFELVASQRIIGRNNADTLGYLKTTLDWNGSKFIKKSVDP